MGVTVKRKLVAPDGGWGWAVAAAFGIYFLLLFSLISSFGLIYKAEFKRLGFTGTQSSFITSTNGGLAMLCGLINGSLLNKFGTRKVSICSAVFLIAGLLMTAYSTTFIEFMLSYGVITSLGMGMGMSSYSLALNTYFHKRRNKVTGYTTAAYGVGTIFFPQLVSYLLTNYSIRDTMLIITAIFGNTMAAALLLQPVKWHMKVEEEEIPRENEEPREEDALFKQQLKDDRDIKPIYNDIATIHTSMSSLNVYPVHSNNNIPTTIIEEGDGSVGSRIIRTISNTFGLHLLSDLIFLNILVGLSIDFFVEFNYIWLIPFTLIESSLTVEQTAMFMSIYAVADILFRLFAPHVASLFKKSNRVMYIFSLIFVIISRTFLLFLTDYISLLFVAVAIGGFRGMRLVHWSLVIPEYMTPDKFAFAFGLLFTLNGFWMFLGAPILGMLRDFSGNYNTCIILLNSVTTATIVMWTIEMVCANLRTKKNSKQFKNVI